MVYKIAQRINRPKIAENFLLLCTYLKLLFKIDLIAMLVCGVVERNIFCCQQFILGTLKHILSSQWL